MKTASKLWRVTFYIHRGEPIVMVPPETIHSSRVEAEDERHALRGVLAAMPAKEHLALMNAKKDATLRATFATKNTSMEAELSWDYRTQTLEIQT